MLLLRTLCSALPSSRCTIIVVIFFLFGPLVSPNSFSAFETCIFSHFCHCWGFHSRHIFPIHSSAAPAPAPVLSCSPNSHRNFVSPTHTSTQTSPLHSRLRALSCTFARSSKFPHFFFFFLFFSFFFFSLFSSAPESFPFDPVQNPWLYVLVQKPIKNV